MSKLQRLEDEMYQVAYAIEILRLCRTCKYHHGQVYGGVELVCAFHPYGAGANAPSAFALRNRGICLRAFYEGDGAFAP